MGLSGNNLVSNEACPSEVAGNNFVSNEACPSEVTRDWF